MSLKKNRRLLLVPGVILMISAWKAPGPLPAAEETAGILTLELRGEKELGKNRFAVTTKTAAWNARQTAIIVCDVWNRHHCASAERRTGELAPQVNAAVKAARDKGVFIIHSPSDCMRFYEDTPQRKRAQAAPFAKAPAPLKWNNEDLQREPRLPVTPGCSCDTAEPCPTGQTWTREHEAIEIAAEDAVSDNGQEIYNLLQARKIENVILMGVHTNVCVLGRPFGIREMVYLGKNVVLCRDLTDSYHRDPGRHFEGLEKVIEHIERYWCPTITSTALTGKPPFRFAEDRLGVVTPVEGKK